MKRLWRSGVVGVIATVCVAGLSSCKKPIGPLPQEPIKVAENLGPWPMAGYTALRLPEKEWNQFEDHQTVTWNPELQYEIVITREGTVQSAKLTAGPGYKRTKEGHELIAGPPPFLVTHLAMAHAMMMARRFEPYRLPDGRPISVRTTDTLYVGLPEAYGPQVPFPDPGDMKAVSMQADTGIFIAKVEGDGTVTFEGEGKMKGTERHVTHIPPQRVTELLQRFREARFTSALPGYQYATDTHWIDLTLRINDKVYSSRIFYGEGAIAGQPDAFYSLALEIFHLSNAERWFRKDYASMPTQSMM